MDYLGTLFDSLLILASPSRCIPVIVSIFLTASFLVRMLAYLLAGFASFVSLSLAASSTASASEIGGFFFLRASLAISPPLLEL